MGLDSFIVDEKCQDIVDFRKDYELHNFFYDYFLSIKDTLDPMTYDGYYNDPFNGYHLPIDKNVILNCINFLNEISDEQETDEHDYSIEKLYKVLKYCNENPNKEIFYTCSY